MTRNKFSKIRRKKSLVNAKFISKQKTNKDNEYTFSNDFSVGFLYSPKHFLQEMRVTNFILKIKYDIALQSMYTHPKYKDIYYFRYKFKRKNKI